MDISVIIPVYNVEEYLLQCLEAVAAAIREQEIEVLMIDDGSTDGSAGIAENFAKRDARFVYCRKENGGPGSARNLGVEMAAGKYLAFIDSDDMVEPDYFMNMFSLAEETQSELTVSNEARFDSQRKWASALSLRAYGNMPEDGMTHIRRNRNLFNDTVVTGKLVLRSFYMDHAFRFPEKQVFEDIPVALRMHCLTNKAAFLKKAEYLWRVRDGETRSITQSNTKLNNLTDRLAMLESIFAFYEAEGNRELFENLRIKTLKVDLMIYIGILSELPEEEALTYIDHLNGFIDAHIDRKLVDRLPVTQRQRYEYLFAGNLEGIRKTTAYHDKKLSGTRVIRQGNGYRFVLPEKLFTIKDHSADNDYRDALPNCSVDAMCVDKDKIEIRAHLFFAKIPVEKEEDLQLELELTGDIHKTRLPIVLIRERNTEITEKYGAVFNENTQELDHYSYDYAGFRAIVELNAFHALSFPEENYFFECIYKTPVGAGRCIIRNAPERYNTKYADSVFETKDCSITIHFDAAKQLYLHVEKTAGESSVSGAFEEEGSLSGIIRSLYGDRKKESRVIRKKDAFIFAGSARSGNDSRQEKECLPVWRITKASDDRLEYEMEIYTVSKGLRSVEIYSENIGTGARKTLSCCPVRRRGKRYRGVGTIEMEASLLAAVTSGKHVLYALLNGETGNELLSPEQFDHEMRVDSASLYFLAEADGRIVMNVFREMPAGERSKGERTYIRKVLYKEYRREPVRERTILFESEGGECFGGVPRKMFDAVRKDHPEYACAWSLKDPAMLTDGNAICVWKGSKEYYRFLATAEYLVTDGDYGKAFVKREEQKLLKSVQEFREVLPE